MYFFILSLWFYIYVYLHKMNQINKNTINISIFNDESLDNDSYNFDFKKKVIIKTDLNKINKLNELQDFLDSYNIFDNLPNIKLLNKTIITTYLIDEKKELELYELLHRYVDIISSIDDKNNTYLTINDEQVIESANNDM